MKSWRTLAADTDLRFDHKLRHTTQNEMANVEITTVPVNTCYLVKCDSCGKTSWKVRTPVLA